MESPLKERERQEGIAFAKRLGRALHRHGAPAYRLEDVLETLSRMLGLRGDFFATPSALFYAFDLPGEGGRAYLQRVHDHEIHFARLIALDRVFNDAVLRRVDLAEANQRLDRALAERSPWPTPLVALAYVAASFAAAYFYGGGLAEMLLAGCAGLALAAVFLLTTRIARLGRLFTALGAAAVSAAATALAAPLRASDDVATLAGLVVLVPGFSITVAAAELALGHPVSGTGRLANAMLTLMMLGLGVAFGHAAAAALLGPAPSAVVAEPVALAAAWWEPTALVLAGLALGVLFQAPVKRLPVIIAAVFVPWFVLRATAGRMGLEGGLFLASFANGLFAHAWARLRDLPSMIVRLPGLLILVPGGTGFLSIRALMEGDALSGVQTLFRVAVAAIAIVTGLLAASIALPPRKAL